jgi:pimeloyl-ACP methyl ester carboxylesterase
MPPPLSSDTSAYNAIMGHDVDESGSERQWMPFLAGLVAGGAAVVLARALTPKPALDTRLIKRTGEDPDVPTTVVVPGILGSELLRSDGAQVWLNAGNALGHHDLALPLSLPFSATDDGLLPGGLLGTDAVLPRLFGFTEYADLLDLLRAAGVRHHVFTYDWRRDIVESARRLGAVLDALAEARDEPAARFNVIGHSMGGLVARYYLRFGGAEPVDGAPITWAGARRIRNLVMVAAPNCGSVQSLDAILNGSRVGLSYTTLAASVIATMPAIYQLLPSSGAEALIDHNAKPLDMDLYDIETWERHGWDPLSPPSPAARRQNAPETDVEPAARRAFLAAALARARDVHLALTRVPATPCPARVVVLGGDCLPTLARAVVPHRRGAPPRFEPWTRQEADAMFEAGDGRVTRASVLASHLSDAEASDVGCGLPEVASAFFGSADHHGIYGEPTFQSVLLRLLLRAVRPATVLRATDVA